MSEASSSPDEPYSWEFVSQVYDYRLQVAERRELFLEVEGLYEAKAAALSAELDAAMAAADPEDHDDIVDDFVWDIRHVDHQLPSIQRAATFIMLVHFLEARLTAICDGIGEELKLDARVKRFRGSGVEPALLFLKKYSKLDLSGLASDFDFLRGCKHLRNALVHSGGHLSEANTRTVKFVRNEPALEGQATGEIHVTSALVVKFLDCLETIFIGLHTAMESFMRQAGNTAPVYLIGTFGSVPIFGPDPQGPSER